MRCHGSSCDWITGRRGEERRGEERREGFGGREDRGRGEEVKEEDAWRSPNRVITQG